MNPDSARPVSDRFVRIGTCSALLAGLGYLGWRVTDLGSDWWISIPLLLLEIWGVAQLGLLAMMGWSPSKPIGEVPDAEDIEAADLVVTATFHSADELERTLVACQSVEGAGRTLVALRPNRPDLVEIAKRFGVGVLECEGNHVDLFRHGVADLDSSIAAWLEAGQMPMRDFLTATVGHFSNPSVAIVQAKQAMLNKDSLANMRSGRDEDAFRSEVAYPGKSRRGDATWSGGGSLVRAEALRSIGDFPADQAALARAQVKLQAAGWLSRYYGERQLLLDTAPDSLESYLLIRRRRAIESLRVFATAENPLRYRGLSLKQRLDHIAFSSTYLASIRQLGLTIVLIGALVTGSLPFGGSARVWASLWLLQFGLGAVARRLLARGTMGFGDWTRQGWRTLSSDLSAIANVTGLTRRTVRFRGEKDAGVRSLSRMRLVSALLVAMNSALIARGLTILAPRMLPRFTTFERVMILLITLAVVSSMIDVLQIAVRRNQRRTSYRIHTRLVGYLDGVKVRIVDLTPNGLGARTKLGSDVEVGSTIDFNIAIPDNDESLEVVKGHGHVRSVTPQDNYDRIGIEFEQLDNDSRARLIDYCAVGHHSQAAHDTTIDLTPAKLDTERSAGSGMKALSGAGVFLGILVLLAGPAALPSLADVGKPATICLTSSTGAPLPGGAVTFEYDREWQKAGTTGKDGCVTASMPPQKTTVAMTYEDVRVEMVQDLSVSSTVKFETISASVALLSSAGKGISGGDVYLDSGEWKEVGTTDKEGRVTLELLPTKHSVLIVYNGVKQETTHNFADQREATFKTISASVALLSSAGKPLSGGNVQINLDKWKEVGTTDKEGRVTLELLPSKHSITMTYNGGTQESTHDFADQPEATFKTVAVYADEGVKITKYRQSESQTFTDGIELLPTIIDLERSDGKEVQSLKLQAGLVNYVPSGRTSDAPTAVTSTTTQPPPIRPTESTTTTSRETTTAKPTTTRKTTTTAKPTTTRKTTTTAKPTTTREIITTAKPTTTRKTTTTAKPTTTRKTTTTAKPTTTREITTTAKLATTRKTTTTVKPTDTTGQATTSTITATDDGSVSTGASEGGESESTSSTTAVAAGRTTDAGAANTTTSEESVAIATTTVLDESDRSDERAPTVEESVVDADARTDKSAPSGTTGDSAKQPSQGERAGANNEPLQRIELAEGMYWSATEPVVAGLQVTLMPVEGADDSTVERYTIRVENGGEALAGPVTFNIAVDDGRELHIESSGRWRCEQRSSTIECVSDADVEPRSSHDLTMSATPRDAGSSVNVAAAVAALLFAALGAVGLNHRRSKKNEIKEIDVA